MSNSLRSPRRCTLFVFGHVGLASFLALSAAFAAPLTVTSTADTGPGTLRDAVTASASGDTIVFDCSPAALNCPATITLSSQGNNQGFPGPTALTISGKSITIQGPASGGVTLHASHGTTSSTSLRLFFVDTGASLKLENLILTGGKAIGGNGGVGGGAAGLGGAIFSQGALTLSGTSFSANGAAGGAIGTASGGGGLGGDGGDSNYGGGGGTGGNGLDSGVGFGGAGGPGLGGAGGGSGGIGSGSGGAGSGGGGGGGGQGGGGTGSEGAGGGAGDGFSALGGNGGFGGGGGAFGNGGFGGGGGLDGSAGIGGYAGGAAFGGAVFARNGTLTVQNTGSSGSILGNSVSAGAGAAAVGSGLFLMSGVDTTFDIVGKYTILDTIGDDSATSLPSGATFTPGNGAGAGITKQGAGTLILSGVNTYAGTTNVNNGVLRVTGSIAGSLVDVAASGILAGDGATGAIDSAGTLAPGTATDPQGLLIASGLTLEAGALSCFHALGSSNATSRLNINGAAIVNGIARIDFASGPSVGTDYTLLLGAFVTGAFAGFETNMPSLEGTLSYTANTVTFTVTANDGLFRDGFEQPASDSPCVAAFAN